MPPLPPGLSERFGPSAFLALLALLLGLQGKRIDELREDMKELRAELKADNRVLSEKMDRLIEALLAVKQA